VRHKARILIASVLFLLAAALFTASAAANERVHITAAESGLYDWETQIFEAQGDVAVTYGDLSLHGDLLTMNTKTGEVWVRGDVRLRQGERVLSGETLFYNFETGQGSLEQAKAEFALPEKTGTVFLKGESVGIDEEKYTVAAAQFTTCDLDESHFHLATKELEYFPGKKVVIRGVTYYEGRVPLFYWPYVVIPLDLEDGINRFTLPVFGYSEAEGYYMKNTFNYYVNSSSYGHLYVDLFTRLGLGVGARHFYELEKLGKGSLYLYGIPTSKSPVLKGAFSHSWKNDNWSFSTASNYENSWARHDLSTDSRLRLTLAKTSAEAWFKYNKNPAASTSEKRDVGVSWSQSLTDSWRLNLQGSLIEQTRNKEETRVLDYLAETVYRLGRHTLTLAAQQQYNPDLLEGESPPWRSVQRIPELKWTVSDLGISGLPLGTQVVLGRYGERPSTVTQNRAFGQLTLSQRYWRPAANTTVNYQGHAAGAVYGNKEKQAWTYGRVGLTQRFTGNLQFTATYSRRDVWGTSPFRFDRQSPLQTLDFSLDYTTAPLRVTARTGYNLLNKQFSTLTVQTTWRPSQVWSISARTDFDLNRKVLTHVIPTVQYKKEDLNLQFGVWYQPDSGVLRRVESEVALPLDTWRISYASVYEPPRQAFTEGKITVTKDLHCRKLSVSYDHVKNSVALQFTINAFPTLPIGWDSEGGLSLFDLEDVADLIGVEE
jgi:lipopolysaccharide export system protein LptA